MEDNEKDSKGIRREGTLPASCHVAYCQKSGLVLPQTTKSGGCHSRLQNPELEAHRVYTLFTYS